MPKALPGYHLHPLFTLTPLYLPPHGWALPLESKSTLRLSAWQFAVEGPSASPEVGSDTSYRGCATSFFFSSLELVETTMTVLLRLKFCCCCCFLFPEVREEAICNSVILWGWSGHFTAWIWWDLYLCWGGCRASKESSACAVLSFAQQYFHILSPSFPSSGFYLIIAFFFSKCLIAFLVHRLPPNCHLMPSAILFSLEISPVHVKMLQKFRSPLPFLFLFPVVSELTLLSNL